MKWFTHNGHDLLTTARTFIKEHGWLVNFQGKRDSFHAIDMAQEHNIRDLKVTYLPDGVSSTWEYLKKISWAIPTIQSIRLHIPKPLFTRRSTNPVWANVEGEWKLLINWCETINKNRKPVIMKKSYSIYRQNHPKLRMQPGKQTVDKHRVCWLSFIPLFDFSI